MENPISKRDEYIYTMQAMFEERIMRCKEVFEQLGKPNTFQVLLNSTRHQAQKTLKIQDIDVKELMITHTMANVAEQELIQETLLKNGI